MGARGPDWSHEETLLLVQMKQEANEKGQGWEYISRKLTIQSNRARSEQSVQRRWDTLKKVYKKIEACCAGGSEDAHSHLDQATLNSLKLATAYRGDWYTILKQVLAEEDRRRKKKKKTQGILRHPPTNNINNNPTTPDQAVTPTAPNVHEAICSPTVEAQNSSPELEDTRYQNAPEALLMQQMQQILQQKQQLLQQKKQILQQKKQILQQEQQNQQIIQQQQNAPAHQILQQKQQLLQHEEQLLQHEEQLLQQEEQLLQQEQQLLQQNQQSIQQQHNAPAHQTIQWPFDQLVLKPKKNFNTPLGDSTAPGEMTEFIELPDKVFSPETLPIMEGRDLEDLGLWRIIFHHVLTQFSGQHDPSIDSATNLSKNPALFGRQSMPQSQSSTACDKWETTLTIRARFTSKETQMVSTSNQATPDHEKPASIELHISARTNEVATHHELSAELQRLKEEQQQQQLWEIQQSQVSKPVTIFSNSALVSNEKPFNPPFAETNQPTTAGLTELVAQMKLLLSQGLADPTPSQSMHLAKSTLTPGATVDTSSLLSVKDRGAHKSLSAMASMKPKVATSHQ